MLVLVCGNINSGKTTAINRIKEILPSYNCILIDRMRQLYGDSTIDGEILARNEFVKAVSKSKNAIVELSGLGEVAVMLEKSLDMKSFIVLEISENADVCISRIASKDFSKTAYPKFSESLPDTIRRIDKEIELGELNKLWQNKALAILKIKDQKSIDNLPFSHYEKFIDVLSVLIPDNNIKEIVTYGSLGREELKMLSDIDCFITTDCTTTEIEELLLQRCLPTFIDTTLNKVTIYFDSLLIEITVTKEVLENRLFYATSVIKNIQGTILKGSSNTFLKLQEITNNYSPNLEYEIDQAIKRLVYYVLSLDRILKNNDTYKFFFHNNIIIHEIVRLNYLFSGETRKEYLPPLALSFCNVNNLVYVFGDDMTKHISNVKNIVLQLLKSINRHEKYLVVLIDKKHMFYR